MKVDPAGDLAKLIDGLVQKRLAEMSVAFPCSVISYNKERGIAVVQPLLQLTEKPPAPIQNVQALGMKKHVDDITPPEIHFPELENGDVVYVVCADRQIRDTLTGSVTKPSSQRIHHRNDAVIVGVFPCSL
ncbi:Gp138 family membrane-puncturing spike protein [Brevibacillus porteri]|uniref:Phage protein Gp138 N-terminal domain-containing protein n=1 Tax=Brevibacillus porteri TaxID=2126350 RepID=A0ABX5FHS1_9BACL|nr:Gp138 family membrane-puncturing spike protein [Brevibacillus porteri]MED1801775.1 Gp138 family membrane-puncturing spike protein [Brevibacillus porteri]MED2134906.1 Gp138 family membrane-puncturing spike protein [Brevibacillus porteri]MED2748413.1 Gp138 family membrane-puncturing spike protein [Brevibacillus porteri]MED2818337.1 Gp138 family membrane-puncturing spike protein [Brevibacillus porteri]MED2897704.1 Gp138 family membrane-puncturing spike protein [Brevibacillus porteri]